MRFLFSIILLLGFGIASPQSQFETASGIYQKYQRASSEGNFGDAISHLNEILELKNFLPPYNVALVYKNLGLMHWNTGDYQISGDYYELALGVPVGEDINSKYLLSGIYSDYGLLHRRLGSYHEAIEYFHQSLAVLSDVPIEDTRYQEQYALLMLNRAIALIDQHEIDEAMDNLRISIGIKSKYGFGYLGSAYFNLGRCHREKNDFSSARYYFEKSIKQWITEYDSAHYQLANVYLNLGSLCLDLGDPEKAISYYHQALDNYQTNFGQSHPLTAGCLTAIGNYHLESGNLATALEFFQESLISICPGFSSNSFFSNPSEIEALSDLRLLKNYRGKVIALNRVVLEIEAWGEKETGSIYTDHGKREILEHALETNIEAISVLERIHNDYVSQDNRLYLNENQKDIFIDGIEIAMELYAETGDIKFKEQAYQFLSSGKSIELRFEMEQKQKLFLRQSSDPMAQRLITADREMETLKTMISFAQSEQKPDTSKIKQWRSSLFSLRREYNHLHDQVFKEQIATSLSNHKQEKKQIGTIQSNIRRGESLIEYAISKPNETGTRRMFCFVTTKTRSDIISGVLDASFSGYMNRIEKELIRFDPISDPGYSRDSLQVALSGIYDILLEPIAGYLDGDLLTVIPDEILVKIPFDALMKEYRDETDNVMGTRYLIEEFDIRTLPNSMFLDHIRKSRKKRLPQVKIFAQQYQTRSAEGLSSLPAVANEVYSVKEITGGFEVALDRSKEAVLKELSDGDIFHFALHSYPTLGDQTSSFMILNEKRDSSLSNCLFNFEIEQQVLSNDLVVLNSCGTGTGKFFSGEGMLSLSRSFLLAGSESIIHTLWPVDDRASFRIIEEFYSELSKGNSKATSLRNAKLLYLESAYPSFMHPYYWAGYQLVGNDNIIYSSILNLRIGAVILVVIFAGTGWFTIRLRRKKRLLKFLQ